MRDSDLLPEPVTTKAQSVRLWSTGAFGCKLRSWRDAQEWAADRDRGVGRVALRVREGRGAGPCHYDVEWWQVMICLRAIVRRGYSVSQVMVCEMAPSEHLVVQGEYYAGALLDGAGGAEVGYLYYSRLKKHMRDALREHGEEARGLAADLILREAMTPSSYEDFRALVDLYPNHVLEVSVFDRCLGDVPGRNALVWEVRRY
jgi:hypothetical protein